ncbi:MAG: diaminopimelate epimerase [Pontiellaceae bacterium]|nr:diaminopimelate epimerase [Pontiellaceae bacterium]
MNIPFTKMHGASNDFILIDDRALTFPLEDRAFIQSVATRRIGIGCEGVILLQPSEQADLRMRFMNPDGNEVEMCGNGARCFARLAYEIGAAPAQMNIETMAGVVRAEVLGDEVRLELTEPTGLQLDLSLDTEWSIDFVNTGVPHVIVWVDDLEAVDIPQWGPFFRYHKAFAPQGTNVNFAQVNADGSLSIRTYERGVEAETMACGTGAAAAGVAAVQRGRTSFPVGVHCAGGFDLVISMNDARVTLTGGAENVFKGEVCYGNRV